MRAWVFMGCVAALASVSACSDDVGPCESTCGDGIIACEETCDDGNTVGGDGCTELCLIDLATCPDADADGERDFRCGGGDCDDSNAAVKPNAVELECNGLDDDCDPSTPDLRDLDGDGVSCDLDCNDEDPAVHPGVTELICNAVDDDCDASTVDVLDEDGDQFDCRVDCDEGRANVNPDQTEACGNGLDDDCNGATDCEDPLCNELPICRGRRGGAMGGVHEGTVTVMAFDRFTEVPVEALEVLIEARGLIIGGQTSTAGEARFSDVPRGPYTVTVRADGWSSVSMVGTRAARVEVPVRADAQSISPQTLEVQELDPSLEGRLGIFFASGQPSRDIIVRRVGEVIVLDADPETEAVDALSASLPEGAPASMGVRIDGDEGESHIAFVSVKTVPEPSLRAAASVQPIWMVSGRVETDQLELVGGNLRFSAFVHAGVFGDVPGALGEARAVIESSNRGIFGVDSENALSVVAPPDLLEVTLVASYERTFGFELTRSELRVRRPSADLDQAIVFDDLRPPPAWLAIDQSQAGRPSFGWDAENGPVAGEGLYELRLYEPDGNLLRHIWVTGGADGVTLPLGAMLPSLTELRVEVRAHVSPGLDFDDFRWSELERNTTHVLSRELELDL